MFAYLWGLLRQRGGVRAGATCLALIAATAFLLCARAHADEPGVAEAAADPADAVAAKEIWSGAEVFGSTWATYTGVTVAAGGIAQEGFRLRLTGGVSLRRVADGPMKAWSSQPFADALAGWQWQIGAVTLKAFAGVTGNAELRSSEPAFAAVRDLRIGPKVALETWWTIDPINWASLDVSFAGPQSFLWSRARYGTRLLPQVSLGPEVGFAGDVAKLGGRIGAFARFDWDTGEIALAGGFTRSGSTIAGREDRSEDATNSRYLTVLWLQRF